MNTRSWLFKNIVINNKMTDETFDKFLKILNELEMEYLKKKPQEKINIHRFNTNLERYGQTIPKHIFGKTQQEITDWLNSFGFAFKSNHNILEGKEIDMYDSSLNLGIEYCGLYWHNENSPQPRNKEYHNDKRLKCESQGIRLITIFEDEWLSREQQIKGFLKSVLHKNSRTIFARKCTVRSITKAEGRDFFNLYHIQGAPNLGEYFAGLFYKDELLGVMSFGKHHRDTTKFVLDRLCFKEDVNVTGGSSKLFKFLLKESGIIELVSWSDNRWSCGAVYKALGFELDTELGPDYSYVTEHARSSKQSQCKKVVKCPAEKTELQWANERGLYRIWDCGKKRWKYLVNQV